MSALAPGDFLRCIEVDHCREFSVEVGKIYTCTEVEPTYDFDTRECTVHGPRCRQGGIRLREVFIPEHWWWCGACFTPIYRPKIKWAEFTSIKLPPDPEKIKRLAPRRGVDA